MIKEAIDMVVKGNSLTMEQAAEVMNEIMDGVATPAQFGAFVTALRLKGETVHEIAGMARVMREKSVPVKVKGPLVDTCGTGGDGTKTFNISTTAAFVVAGAGGQGSQARQPRHVQRMRQRRRPRRARCEIRHRRRGGGALSERGWHRIHVRAQVPPGHEIRRQPQARDRHTHRVQHTRPDDQPGAGAIAAPGRIR